MDSEDDDIERRKTCKKENVDECLCGNKFRALISHQLNMLYGVEYDQN